MLFVTQVFTLSPYLYLSDIQSHSPVGELKTQRRLITFRTRFNTPLSIRKSYLLKLTWVIISTTHRIRNHMRQIYTDLITFREFESNFR